MGGGPIAHDALGIMVFQFNESSPFMQMGWAKFRNRFSILVTNKVNIVEVIVNHTTGSNNMVDMEAPLPQDLPREAHSTSKGVHGTLGSPHPLPSWVI